MSPAEQAKLMGQAWEALPQKPKRQVRFRIIGPGEQIKDYYLGAHAPHLTSEEINRIHQLWLDVTHEKGAEHFHHHEVVAMAISRLEQELKGPRREEVMRQIRNFSGERRDADADQPAEES